MKQSKHAQAEEARDNIVFGRIINSLDNLACAIREAGSNEQQTRAILERISHSERNIMSAISEYAAKQAAFNTRQGAAIDGLVSSATGLTADVLELNRKITELQNSPGTVTPEDQASLDELQTQGEAIATRLEGVSAALSALDSQTPPAVPTPTP